MRILFQDREGEGWGGAAHQIKMLMESLKKLGYSTTFSMEEDFSKCDIIHANHINLTRKILYENCNKPIVFKCIWHTYEPRVDNSKAAYLAKKSAWLTVESAQERKLMLNFLKSELSPNELESVKKKIMVFKPGVDNTFKNQKPLNLRKKVHINGWYNNNKGQAEVVKACKELKLPVITSGRSANAVYINYCKSFEYGEILGPLEKSELNEVYNESRVYVNASLYENHSASMCEAIACGCRIVSSSNHLANQEYDKPGYYTYKWGDFDDLKAKILEAYHSTEDQKNEYWTHDRLAQENSNLFKSLYVKTL